MKKIRPCVVLAVLMLLCAGCAAGSVQPTMNMVAPAVTINSPAPIESAGAVLPTPTETATATPSPTATTNTFKFNEENFTQYFQFGMSREDLINKLDELGIKVNRDEIIGMNYPDDFLEIATDNFYFYFNSNNQLYLIGATGLETAKGLKVGDLLDQMRLLYGTEDEYDIYKDEYIYYKNDYMISFLDYFESGKINEWLVFVDTWNNPNILDGARKKLGGDDSIQFSENNYNKYFHFGMSRQDVRNRLTDLGVRITLELDLSWLDSGWTEIDTDHISFCFDEDTGTLYDIDVWGWETAKGLKEGDSLDRLHHLYGNENHEISDNGYIFDRKGYYFIVTLSDDPGDPSLVEQWSVATKYYEEPQE